MNADGASATVDITITGNGVIAFDPTLGLIGLTTELFLNLDRGTASGHIEVSGLNVSYTLPGSPNLSELTGTVGGVNGQPAAGNALHHSVAQFELPAQCLRYSVGELHPAIAGDRAGRQSGREYSGRHAAPAQVGR
ncbi:MAG: hypothetical protein WDN04_09485 [Rhodospirillales bacterium]